MREPAQAELPSAASGLGAQGLAEAWRSARAAWPSVQLGAEAFIAHLARHLPAHAVATDGLMQINVADLYLACACAAGDVQAIEAFERHCLGGVNRALARLGFDADTVSEVKQLIRCRVLLGDRGPPRILEFSGRGALRAWVRVIAVREALRMTRRSDREIEIDDIDKLQAFVTATGLEHEKQSYRHAFREALDRALRALPSRDRVMLRQHVLDGMTIDQLGALYRMHRTTAARALERARRFLLAATRAHMRVELDVSSTELDSILRLIRSCLDVSLRGLRRRHRR
jgi:RNA polymerase sigma-70 factor (ECF subfamily)